MNKFKKFFAVVIAVMMVLEYMPIREVFAAAPTVTSIKLIKVEQGVYNLIFDGTNLSIDNGNGTYSNRNVTITDSNGYIFNVGTIGDSAKSITLDLTKKNTSNNPNVPTKTLGEVIDSALTVNLEGSTNNYTFNLGGELPAIKVNTPAVYPGDGLIISGYDDIGNFTDASKNLYMKISNVDLNLSTSALPSNSSWVEVANKQVNIPSASIPSILGSNFGSRDIKVGKTSTQNGADIEEAVNYPKIFRYSQKLNIYADSSKGVIPSLGFQGSKFKIYTSVGSTDVTSDLKVYFLLNKSDSFTATNASVLTKKDDSGSTVLEGTVPNVAAGLDYYMIITRENNGDVVGENVLKLGDSNGVEIKFKVITDSRAMTFKTIYPKSFSDTGVDDDNSFVEAKYFATLNIDGLAIPTALTPTSSLSADKTVLTYTYTSVGANVIKYNGVDVDSVSKSISITAGSPCTFNDATIAKNVLSENNNDRIYFNIPSITLKPEDGNEATRYATLQTSRKIVLKDGSIINFPDENNSSQNSDLNKIIISKSEIKPKITAVSPKFDQSNNAGFESGKDLYVAITGENFLVWKYKDSSGNTHYRYPSVIVGGSLDSGTKIEKDQNGGYLWVFADTNNNPIDLTQEKSFGKKLVVKIPAALTQGITNTQTINIYVQNPLIGKPDDTTNSLTRAESFDMRFTKIGDGVSRPEIGSVEPTSIPLNGGTDEIKITGNGFDKDSIVTVDGQKVTSTFKDKTLITFKAPPYKLGDAHIQVINSNGTIAVCGNDSYSSIKYIKVGEDLTITSIAPSIGTSGTIMTISGSKFAPPDTSVSDWKDDPDTLIGSKVLFNDIDLNEYNRDSSRKIQFLNYKITKPIFFVNSNNEVDINSEVDSVFEYSDATTKKYLRIYEGTDHVAVIQDNKGSRYTVYGLDGDKLLIKDKDGNQINYDSTQEIDSSGNGILKLNLYGTGNEKYTAITPYRVQDGVIVGKRTFVKDSSNITVIVPKTVNGEDLPPAPAPNQYNVTVKNPDTKYATKEKAFEYLSMPTSNPKITGLEPLARGPFDGGNPLMIKGTGFLDGVKVSIGSQEIDSKDIVLLADGIYIKSVPACIDKNVVYDSTLKQKSAWVKLIVTNPDAKADSTDYQYVTPLSSPKIYSVDPQKASSSGNVKVVIKGTQFRQVTSKGIASTDPNDLPIVYFGSQRAKDVKLSTNLVNIKGTPKTFDQITCTLPKSAFAGKVDVIVVNNDAGYAVLKDGFLYTQSTPAITSLTPSKGPKEGGTTVTIGGSGFVEEGGVNVKFGDFTNRNADVTDPKKSGYLIGSDPVTVSLDSDFDVTCTPNSDGTYGIKVTSSKITTPWSQTLSSSRYMYINLGKKNVCTQTGKIFVSGKTDASVEHYGGVGLTGFDNENIKVELTNDNRLIVTRKYAADVQFDSDKQLTIKTPPMADVGLYDVYVINADGGTAKSPIQFEYKNPGSKPKITNILKGTQQPTSEKLDDNTAILVQQVSSKGGSQLTILGDDFRDGLTIKIGGKLATIKSNPITKTKIIVAVPAGADVIGQLLKVVVENNDGGIANSADNIPPIYVRYVNAESDPTIVSIDPDKGSVKGLTTVKIKGTNFKPGIKVSFGEKQATSVTFVDYKNLTVKVPAAEKPGAVDVTVENLDAGQATLSDGFTYISSPVISDVDPKQVSALGGDIVNIKGSGFVEGAKVYIGATLKPYVDSGLGGTTPNNLVYKDDKAYTIEGGTLVDDANVKFIDEGNIKVKVPAGKLNTKGILVLNPDGGASDNYLGFMYVKPRPQAPKNVKAEYIFSKYIRVSWDSVDNLFDNKQDDDYYYEVYRVLNGDYELVAKTQNTGYLETDLIEGASYKFIVKALKNGTDSEFSMESNVVIPTGVQSSKVQDGPIVATTNNVVVNPSGDVIVNIGTSDVNTTIDLTDVKFANLDKLTINIPASVIKDGTKSFDVLMNGFKITIPSKAFNTDAISAIQDAILLSHSVGRLNIDFGTGNMEKSKVPKGSVIISPIYNIGAEVQLDRDVTPLEAFADKLNMLMSYDEDNVRKLDGFKYTPVLCYYDYGEQQWKQLESTEQDGLKNALTDKTGTFTIIDIRQ